MASGMELNRYFDPMESALLGGVSPRYGIARSSLSRHGRFVLEPRYVHLKWRLSPDSKPQKVIVVNTRAAFDSDLSEQVSGQGRVEAPLQVAAGVGILLGFDRVLSAALVRWTPWRLPSSTVGMISATAALLLLDRASPKACGRVVSFFGPAVAFLQRWMPVFYAPAVALLPLGVNRLQVVDGMKLLLMVVFSWVATLSVAGSCSTLVRRFVSTRLEEAPSMLSSAPFSIWEAVPWLAAGAAGFGLAYVSPALLSTPARTLLPFCLSATVVGFLLGSFLPGPVKRILHPVITCATFLNAAVIFYSITTEQSYFSVLQLFYTNNLKNPGAGDILMALLGPLAISYCFLLYRQRRMIFRHAAELATVVPVAGLFSLFITKYVGRALQLNPQLVGAVVPSSITFAFSTSMGERLQANLSLVVTCCVLTGLLGANLGKLLLTKIEDPVARGLAASCSSHGYGSVSAAVGEPDLLPLCAASYVLMGAFCSVACTADFPLKFLK